MRTFEIKCDGCGSIIPNPSEAFRLELDAPSRDKSWSLDICGACALQISMAGGKETTSHFWKERLCSLLQSWTLARK